MNPGIVTLAGFSPSGGTWSGTAVSGNTFNPSAAGPGTFILTYSVGAGTCINSDTIHVMVTPLPNVTVNSATICAGESATLTAAGATSYSWNTGASASTITVTPAVTTSYTVTGNSAASGCSQSATATVTVNPLPVVIAGSDITLCNQPIPYTLSGYSPGGGTWSGQGVTAGGVFTPTMTGTFTLTYAFTNSSTGCFNSDSIIIDVIVPAIADAGTGSVYCLNSGITALTGFTPATGTWSGPGVVGTSFNPASAGAGSFILTYSVGAGTCLNTDTIQVTVNPLPAVTVNSTTICAGQAAVLTANGADSYTWDTGSNMNPLSVSPAATTTFTVTGTASATGCQNTAAATVTVNLLPAITAGSDVTLCNQPIPYTLTGYSPAGGIWSGTGVTAGGVFTPSAVGVFTLSYTSVNVSTGCSNSDSIIVTVVAPAIANAGSGNVYCLNSGVTALTGYSPAGGIWTGAGITGNTFDPAAAGVGNFVLSYSIGSGTCLNTDTIQVIVNPLPNVTASSSSVCAGQTATLTANGATAYSWSNGSTGNPVMVTPSATTTYTVTGTLSATGCSASATSTVTVNPLPVVSAGSSITLCDQPISHTLTGYTPPGGTWTGTGVTAGGVFTPAGTGVFTLTYTFINNINGCSNSDTMSVFVITPVVADAGPDEAVCLNSGLLTLTGYVPAAGSWSGTGVTSSGVFDPALAGVGSHILTISYGAGTCFTQDTKTVIVKPLPAVNAGPGLTVCTSTPAFNLTGNSPAGGTWVGTGISNPLTGSFDPGSSGAGTFTLTYIYTDPVTSCTDSSTRTITVGALPVVAFSHVPIGCVNAPVVFSNTSTGAASYLWDFGDGTSSAGTAPSHIYTAAGTYTVKLIAFSSLGCSDSLSGSIQIITAPASDFDITPPVGCAPLNVSFTNNSTGSFLSTSWNLGNGTTSSLVNAPAQIYTQGIYDTVYYITLTNTNLCGTDIKTDSVLVRPIPVGFGTNVTSGCSPLLISFNNTSTGNASTYTWSFGDGTANSSDVNPPPHVFYTGTSDTTYYITLIGSNMCGSDTISKPILVHPNTVTSFFTTNPISGCGPLTVSFTNFSTGGSIYEWEFGDGNVSTSMNATHIYTAPGIYTCYLYVNNGCSFDTSSVNITVNPGPSLSYTTDVSLTCANQPVQFTNTSTGAASFNWNFGDGTSSTLTNPVHSYGAPGVYTITLSGVSTSFGCIDSVSQAVTISALPVPAIAAAPTFGCGPLTVNFTNTSTNANFYAWNFDDGNTSASASPINTFTLPGTYNVVLIAENLQGCVDSLSIPINVYPQPTAAFSLPAVFSCSLPANVNLVNGSTGAATYTWDFGNGQTTNLNSPLITYTAHNTYQILLTAVNTYGCSDTATATFFAIPTPVVSFAPDVSTGCEPLTVSFTNNSINGTNYLWQFGTGDTSSLVNPAFTYNNAGSYNVTLTVSNQFCSSTFNASTINVRPTPTAGFNYEQVYTGDIPNGTITFNNISAGANSYTWNFGDGFTSTETDPIHQFPGTGQFSTLLTASNSYQCTDTAIVTVIPDYFSGLFVPNALMPDNPAGGESTLFLPKGKSLRAYRLQIFDTWGIQMFESTLLDANGTPVEGWDGTSKGVQCPQDVYVWKIDAIFTDGTIWPGKKYPDGKTDKTGTVTLIR
jgi:PKD repeat protein